MEFPFNVNHVLPDEISLVDEGLDPFRGKYRRDRVVFANKQTELKEIIDMMGEASTKAQSLRSPITSSIKLSHSDHKVYISKDSSANNDQGAVVGIIKIGHKKLFILDFHNIQHEVNPLCVLDFYIHESRQRTGCGKRLFDHMIKMEGIPPEQLAIDRPSHKFLSFLKKHYHLDKPVPQVNNFVIYTEFFRDLQAVGLVLRRNLRFTGGTVANRPPIHPYKRQIENEHLLSKRQATNRPLSSTQSASETTREAMDTTETTDRGNEALKDITLPSLVPRPPGRHSASRSHVDSAGSRWILDVSVGGGSSEVPNAFNADRGLAARATSYSRYTPSRENSAPEIRQTRPQEPKGPLDSFERVSSGGRTRNLHLSSAGNPLAMNSQRPPENKPQVICPPTDHNANQTRNTAVNSSFLSPSGNYSISHMHDNLNRPQRPLGTGWNVFGVPARASQCRPGTLLTARKNQGARTFPY